MQTHGLSLPYAGSVRCGFLFMVVRPVAFALTVVANLLRVQAAKPDSQEVTMEKQTAHRKVARISMLETLSGVGTAAIGGILAG